VIASGDKVAFGAPRFPFSGVAVAVDDREEVGVGGGGGVSLGSGFGEDFLFALDDEDALGDGETDFFLGDEVGEGDADSFFAVVDFFRLCGVGVGVGVEKIFLIFSPTDSSAANGGEIVADRIRTDARNVESLGIVGRDPSTPLRFV
jgi:hypothetical protein